MKKIVCILLLVGICFSLVACATQDEEYKIYLAYTENWKDTINNASLGHNIDYIVVEYKKDYISSSYETRYWLPRGVGEINYNEYSYTPRFGSIPKPTDLPTNMVFNGDILQVTYTPHDIVSFPTLGSGIVAIILYCH